MIQDMTKASDEVLSNGKAFDEVSFVPFHFSAGANNSESLKVSHIR